MRNEKKKLFIISAKWENVIECKLERENIGKIRMQAREIRLTKEYVVRGLVLFLQHSFSSVEQRNFFFVRSCNGSSSAPLG